MRCCLKARVSNMERYEAYKDSGVEWIGEIPEGWRINRLKYLAANHVIPAESEVGRYLGLEQVQSWTMAIADEEERETTASGILYDDACVLFGKLRPYLAKVALPNTSGPCSSEFLVLHPHSANRRFLAYTLVSKSFINEVNALTYGVRMPRAGWDLIGNIQIPVPHQFEQQAIADYLDDKTAEIDALVADCEREVELLQEYRKAVIYEAVTKGLDPDAPMKNSGIEWIGEIPEGWRIVRVKFLANRLNVGVVINPSTYYDDNGTIPFLKGSNIQGESIDLSDVSMITEVSNELLQKTQIHTGDIVMVRVGDPGRSVVVPPVLDGANVASMLEVTCGDAVIPEYLCRVFNSHLSALQVGHYTYGAAMKQINVSDLAEFYIPLPESIREQERMMSELNRKTSQIDSLIEAKQSMADKLSEYRRALISEAVTGKFKVPGA